MKTKYIKVSVSERLPENTGIYIVEVDGKLIRTWFNGQKFLHNLEIIPVEYWLEEVPDYEEEMKEMLEEVLNESYEYNYVSSDLYVEIEELLTKLKTES